MRPLSRSDGVQIGSRFALTEESSAHNDFKDYCLTLKEGDTKLLLKKLAPTRLAKNAFRDLVEDAENKGASVEEMRDLLGKGRAKKGIFEGDLDQGELEIGQVTALIDQKNTVAEVMAELVEDFKAACQKENNW